MAVVIGLFLLCVHRTHTNMVHTCTHIYQLSHLQTHTYLVNSLGSGEWVRCEWVLATEWIGGGRGGGGCGGVEVCRATTGKCGRGAKWVAFEEIITNAGL